MARPKNTQNIGKYKHDVNKMNLSGLEKSRAAYSTEVQHYKDLAAIQRNNRTYNIEEITRAMYGMINYVLECVNENKPATVAGLILASGTNRDFYYKAKAGKYDHITIEYMELNNIQLNDCYTDDNGVLLYDDTEKGSLILSLSSHLIEKCLLLIENQLNIQSLTDKSMARTTGAIFTLKSVFNYNDKPETEAKTVNNTLIVNASPDQTAQAMQLLLKDK